MRRFLKVLAAVTALAIAVAAAPAAASTNPVALGAAGPGGARAGAGSRGTGTPMPVSRGGDGGGTGAPACVYVLANPSTVEILPDSPPAGPGTGGFYYSEYCASVFEGFVYVPNSSPAPTDKSPQPAQLAQEAVAHAPFPPLTIVMSPPATREAVNFPIFLSLSGYSAVTATASAGGVTSTVTISPTSVTWDMGDGNDVTCDGPGVPYNPALPFDPQLGENGLPACGYKYALSSANQPGEAFKATATVQYNATWTVTGAPGGGNLGPIDRTATVNVTVGEIEVLNN